MNHIFEFNSWFCNKFGWFFTNGTKYQQLCDTQNKKATSTTEDLDLVGSALRYSRTWGLEAEVVTWALCAMKQDPSLSIEEAIKIGFMEWVK